MCKLETSAASGSSRPDSARSWNMLGHTDGFTSTILPRSHGPGSSDDIGNTRRWFILSRSQKINMHGVPSYYGSRLNNTTLGLRIGSIAFGKSNMIASNKPISRTLWTEIKSIVSPVKLIVLSATPKQLSRFVNPTHLKIGNTEDNFRLCGKIWLNSSKFSSLKENCLHQQVLRCRRKWKDC